MVAQHVALQRRWCRLVVTETYTTVGKVPIAKGGKTAAAGLKTQPTTSGGSDPSAHRGGRRSSSGLDVGSEIREEGRWISSRIGSCVNGRTGGA